MTILTLRASPVVPVPEAPPVPPRSVEHPPAVDSAAALASRPASPRPTPPVVRRPRPGEKTLVDLFAFFQQEHLSDRAASTRYGYATFFRQVVAELGPLPLQDVTPDVLRAWKMRLSERHAPATVHKYLPRLDHALRVCVDEYGWLKDNPMRRIQKPSPGRGRVRFLSPEERSSLLAACQESRNPLLYPIVVVALGTGGRKNEIRRLLWEQVDLERQVVRFLKTKTDRDRAVPLVGEAFALLEELARRRRPTDAWVFPTWNGKHPTPLTSPWETARAQAGISNFRFHDLRHTFASYMALSGATLREIADALGHANIQQTMVYAHLTESHTRNIVERMTAKFLTDPPEEGPHGR